jgi:HAD superfamily hydrolase (TIGR01548 family)
MRKKFDAIIFDMDGVMVDVSRSYREAIRQTAAYFLGREVTKEEVERIKNRVGMNNDWDATYKLIDDSKLAYEEVKSYFQAVYLGDNNNRGLITRERLLMTKKQFTRLKDKYVKLGIATGRPRKEADYVISRNQLTGLFDCLVCMEDVKRGKPYPDSILMAIGILKTKNPVYIGDSLSDILAAEAAGIPCFYIGKQNVGTKRFPSVIKLYQYLL